MSIETLYSQVTEAIMDAQELRAKNDPAATDAYLDVSRLEEQIAAILPASGLEGAVARRGAVRAALRAGQRSRAEDLAARYASEEDASETLKKQLIDILASRKFAPVSASTGSATDGGGKITRFMELASGVFTVLPDETALLVPAPAEVSGALDAARAESDYAEMRRSFAAVVAFASGSASRGVTEVRVSALAAALQAAAPEDMRHCVEITLNRALDACREALARLGETSDEAKRYAGTLNRHYERLPALFPRIAILRRQKTLDALPLTDARPDHVSAVRAIIDLATASGTVLGDELRAEFQSDKAAIELPVISPDDEGMIRWTRVQAMRTATLKAGSVAGAIHATARKLKQDEAAELESNLVHELTRLPVSGLPASTTSSTAI